MQELGMKKSKMDTRSSKIIDKGMVVEYSCTSMSHYRHIKLNKWRKKLLKLFRPEFRAFIGHLVMAMMCKTWKQYIAK